MLFQYSALSRSFTLKDFLFNFIKITSMDFPDFFLILSVLAKLICMSKIYAGTFSQVFECLDNEKKEIVANKVVRSSTVRLQGLKLKSG